MPGKRLVVDTCVSRSAGDKTDVPDSLSSRQALEAIRNHKEHKLAFNTALKAEWMQHASNLARSFLVSMIQRRRVEYVRDDAFSQVLRGCAHQFVDRESKAHFEKDAHVVACALAADFIILSNESRLRSQLVAVAQQRPVIANLIWVSPREEGLSAATWIEAGATETTGRKIADIATPPSHS